MKITTMPLTLHLQSKIEGSHKSYSCIYLCAECDGKDYVYLGTKSSKLYIYELSGIELKNERFINPHC